MPPELTYYLVWYDVSRIALLVVIHFALKQNAQIGVRGLGDSAFLLFGFIPVLAEAGGAIVAFAVAWTTALGWVLRGIADFYFNRYGVRRE